MKTANDVLNINSDEFMNLYKMCSVKQKQIYHYTSPEGLYGILIDKDYPVLRFTQYDCVNDMTERKDIISFFKTYCDEKVEAGLMDVDFAEMVESIKCNDSCVVSHEFVEEFDFGDGEKVTANSRLEQKECYTYICCFSENSDMLPMWNYYTKSNKYEGYSICFEKDCFSHGIGHNKGFSISLDKVIYDDETKRKIADTLLLNASKEYINLSGKEKANLKKWIEHFMNRFQFVFKNSAFAHEKEIRATLRVPISFAENEILSKRKYKVSNGIFIPYVEYKVPDYRRVSITVAPTIKEDIAVKNLTDMLIDHGYKNVRILRSKVPIRF